VETVSTVARRRLGWAVLAVTILLLAGLLALFAGTPSSKLPKGDRLDLLGVLFAVAYGSFAVVGALIVSQRPDNAIGWLLSAIGLVNSVWYFATVYATQSLVGNLHWLPAGEVAAWLANVLAVPSVWLIAPVFVLFPTGRLLAPGWRTFIWLVVAGAALGVLADAVRPGPVEQVAAGVDNPLGVASLRAVTETIDALVSVMFALLLAAGVVCLVRRFRLGAELERLQLKWFAYAAAFAFAQIGLLAVHKLASLPQGGLLDFVASFLLFLAVVAIPGAVGIAVLRHRLYDIDVVINRTLVYGSLTATLAAAYLGSVLLLQLALDPVTSGSSLAVAVSTLGVAALFRPARGRIQAAVDRRFYRRRYDAARTLEQFSSRLREQVDLEALGGELRSVVQDTMQPAHVSLWLRQEWR
jgi:hypothetical protein